MKLLAINSAHGSSVLRIDTAGLVACLILERGAYLIGARPLIASREQRAGRSVAFTHTVEQANILAASTRRLRSAAFDVATSSLENRNPAPTHHGDQPTHRRAHRPGRRLPPGDAIDPARRDRQRPAIRTDPDPGQLGPEHIEPAPSSYTGCATQCPDISVTGFELSVAPNDATATTSFSIQLMWYVQPVGAESKH